MARLETVCISRHPSVSRPPAATSCFSSARAYLICTFQMKRPLLSKKKESTPDAHGLYEALENYAERPVQQGYALYILS